MAFYGRSANEHVDLHLSVVVEGIPFVFVERTLPTSPAVWSGRTPIVCLTRVEEGESTLSYEDRREMAATLDLEMLDDAGVLADLFATASRSVTWASATSTVSATTITLASTAALVGGQHIYVGAETITVGTVASGTSLTGCTRGAFGSTAAALYGTASDGDSVYVVPPFWRGRRVSLYGHAPDGAGLYTSTLLGTYLIDEAPVQAGDLRWTLRCAGIVQEYWERSIGLGLREQAALEVTVISTAIGVRVEDATAFRLGSSFPTYAAIDATSIRSGREVFAIYEVTSVDTTNDIVSLALSPSFGTPHILTGVGQLDAKIRPIATFGGSALLYLLLSREGQGATSYDRLPGRLPASTYEGGWRMGAAFTTSEVDIAAFEAVPFVNSLFVVEREEKLTDVLREWTLLTNTAIVSTVDGKIKPITLAPPRIINTTTIGADDVIPDGPLTVTCDEANVYPLLTVRGGYDIRSGDFTVEAPLINVDLAKKYQRNTNKLEVEIKSIGIDGGFPIGFDAPAWRNPVSMRVEDLIVYVDAVMKGSTLGRRFLSLSLSHEHLGLRIGDVVTLGTDLPDAYDLPDFRGGSILGLSARVVARRPRYDQARVDVRLELIDRLLHVCPAATITAYDGLKTYTLSTTTPEVSGASPAEDFWIGAAVLFVDRSSLATTPATHLTTITAIPSTTQITVDVVPSFSVQTGVDYVVLDPETSGDGVSDSKYSLIEMAKLADADGNAGSNANTDNEPRWR
jgi:hypothetical protein